MTIERASWRPSETGEGTAAYVAGYELNVERSSDQRAVGKRWFWSTLATSAVSEYPEVQDCGFASTEVQAEQLAERAARKAVQTRAREAREAS